MKKRIDIFKQIDDILADINKGLKKFQTLQVTVSDTVIRQALNDYILLVAYLNYQFILYLMNITPDSVKKDIIDKEFRKMMEREFPNEDKK